SGHIKVADLGLVGSVQERLPEDSTAANLPGLSPCYASPERFRGVIGPTSDQYSLAIVYQELLTGTLPFPGKTFNDLRLQHTTHEPDLNPLPATERPVVARALAKNPQMRFASCTDFVRALASGSVLLPASPTPKPGEHPEDAEPDWDQTRKKVPGPSELRPLPRPHLEPPPVEGHPLPQHLARSPFRGARQAQDLHVRDRRVTSARTR